MNSQPAETELVVERYLAGVRIDSFLARHFRNHSPYRLARLVRSGQVIIDGVPVLPGTIVSANQVVRVRLSEPPEADVRVGACCELEVIHDDPWLCVINKPAGVVAHQVGRYVGDTLMDVLQSRLDEQTSLRGLLRAGIVHRLDRMTSGAMLIAKEHRAHRHLSIQFQQHRVQKSYYAIVFGVPEWSETTIDLPIGKRPGKSVLASALPDARDPRPAKTIIRVLAEYETAAMVEAVPLTGRVHQIRVHLAAVGLPILGDEFYGKPESLAAGEELGLLVPDSPRHLLHARKLQFEHPVSHESLQFAAAVPWDMTTIIAEGLC